MSKKRIRCDTCKYWWGDDKSTYAKCEEFKIGLYFPALTNEKELIIETSNYFCCTLHQDFKDIENQ